MNAAQPQVEAVQVASANGYSVPVRFFAADTARANIVLMAALGVAARFYTPLAEALRSTGLNVALIEQRGHGDSALRASRRVDFGFRDTLVDDLPAVLDWLAARAPQQPTYLMGHSLGGHYAAMSTALMPTRIDGVILAACGTPWVEAFEGKTRKQLNLLVRLMPPLMFLIGYYPGEALGFGGREARTLMREWLVMAKSNAYRAEGLAADLDAGIGRYSGPVLSLRMADDAFAPEAAMAAITDKFRAASVSKVVLSAAELGDRADHFRWARSPVAVAAAVGAWLPAPR